MAKKDTIPPHNPPQFKHWRFAIDNAGIHGLYFDRAGENTNTLGAEPMLELARAIDFVHKQCGNGSATGLAFFSAKESGFIAGADIREFGGIDRAQVAEIIRNGHAIFQKIENLPCPTVAAVSGFCLGGGLELALCCDYIIAHDIPSTQIGLPEVKIGIYPGLGGSVRLTERVGGFKGLMLMLSGRVLTARAAHGAGVIDEIVGQHGELYWHARRAVQQKRRAKPAGLLARLSNAGLVRPVLATVMRKQTAKKVNPAHYPAPFALIDAWRLFRGNRKRMFAAEVDEVSRLMVGSTAISLRRVFTLMGQLKGLGKPKDRGKPKDQGVFKVRRVHVVGAGVMGGDIAAVCAARGLLVTLQDRELTYIEAALKRASKTFKKIVKKPLLVKAAQSRLQADVNGEGARRADVVIEAIFEDVDAKRKLLQSLEPVMRADAVLATNTSAIPLEQLAPVLARPERLIGLHFFNPAAKMPLVEVVRSASSTAQEIEKGCSFCAQIGKFPLPVKSSPGFLVNRVLAPYMLKALSIHLEGRSKPLLDAAATGFGMPMGPLELADTVGLDVCLKVAESLTDSKLTDSKLADTNLKRERDLLQQLVAAGKLGKKSGEGLYTWKQGKPVREEVVDGNTAHAKALAERLLQPFLDECTACLADEIVESADLLDAGIIFGTGFAPFLGGPMHYLSQQQGAQRAASGEKQ